jgi:hypothetical protein
MTSLLLRQIGKDDYAVIDAGERVGRIRCAAERARETWLWNVTVSVPGAGNGTASDIEAAKIAFRQSWLKFKGKIGEARLARALEEAQNARERFEPR